MRRATVLPADRQGAPRQSRASVRQLFGVPVDGCTMSEAIAACDEAISQNQQLMIGVVNAAKIVNMQRDPRLRDAVLSCDLVLADGQAVVWASRLLGRPLPERVTGIDLFTKLLTQADARRLRVYFLGGTGEVLTDMIQRIRRDYPGLHVAGSQDGYFELARAAEVAEQIRLADADLLFVGMTSPKKEVFLDAWGSYTGVRVCHGVGGSFDILAGKTRRAPVLWQRAGLEWLYRVMQEPGRLWRRYLVTNLRFLALTAVEAVHPTPAYPRPQLHATGVPAAIGATVPSPRTPPLAEQGETTVNHRQDVGA